MRNYQCFYCILRYRIVEVVVYLFDLTMEKTFILMYGLAFIFGILLAIPVAMLFVKADKKNENNKAEEHKDE